MSLVVGPVAFAQDATSAEPAAPTVQKTTLWQMIQQGGWAGLLAQVVETAINTAVIDYVPIARQVNSECLEAIPAGKYHSRHQLDQQDPVKVINEP